LIALGVEVGAVPGGSALFSAYYSGTHKNGQEAKQSSHRRRSGVKRDGYGYGYGYEALPIVDSSCEEWEPSSIFMLQPG